MLSVIMVSVIILIVAAPILQPVTSLIFFRSTASRRQGVEKDQSRRRQHQATGVNVIKTFFSSPQFREIGCPWKS
jgi:hypothetical protein